MRRAAERIRISRVAAYALCTDGDAILLSRKDYHGVRILYRVRVTGGELRDEVDGSSDTARWVPRDEVDTLPIVDLVQLGLRLAFD